MAVYVYVCVCARLGRPGTYTGSFWEFNESERVGLNHEVKPTTRQSP